MNPKKLEAFETDLRELINKHGIDTELSTPDYVVSATLGSFLITLQMTIIGRCNFFGETKNLSFSKESVQLNEP